MYVKQAGEQDQTYYAHTDHLGSIVKLTDNNGTPVFQASYDAWGLQTLSESNTFSFHRGYTGHEHLPDFGLINMTRPKGEHGAHSGITPGRMYHPVLGRFLSPDPFVQAPEYSQNFNRYSYCLNNPLVYTDPSGEIFWTPLTFISDFIGKAFFQGGLDPTSKTARREAWRNFDPTASWSVTNKAWQIDAGLFRSDSNKEPMARIWEVISRHTWQAPQTFIGYVGAGLLNRLGKVRSVTNYGGATVIETYREWNRGNGITFGSYIFGEREILADPLNALFQHEYGHYLQSQATGWYYLFVYGLPSAFSEGDHNIHAVEQDANIRAFKYFNKYEKKLFDIYDEDGIYSGGWNFRENPILDYDRSLPFNSETNQNALRKGRKKMKIEDYFGYINIR